MEHVYYTHRVENFSSKTSLEWGLVVGDIGMEHDIVYYNICREWKLSLVTHILTLSYIRIFSYTSRFTSLEWGLEVGDTGIEHVYYMQRVETFSSYTHSYIELHKDFFPL